MKLNRRVVHITSVHPAQDTRIFVKECVTLAQHGWDVTLLVLGAESRRIKNVEIIGIPFQGGRIKRFISGPKLLRKKAVELAAAVYHIHDPELLPLAARLIKLGYTVIYDAHEDLPRQVAHKHYIPRWLKSIASNIIERVENHYASRMSAIVTVTPTIVRRFQKIHARVVEVCNYPDFNDIALPQARVNSRSLCYVGGITEARGIRELLDALQHADVQLILAGACSPSSLLDELKQHPAWSKVDYRGFLDRDGVNQVMQDSAAGLVTLRPHPSYQTAYPVKMFEYMAAGLPVIATRIDLWESILVSSNAGICVDISDIHSYAKAMEFMVSNDAEAHQMGLCGRQAVEQKYNWTHEATKLLNLYNDLVQ